MYISIVEDGGESVHSNLPAPCNKFGRKSPDFSADVLGELNYKS